MGLKNTDIVCTPRLKREKTAVLILRAILFRKVKASFYFHCFGKNCFRLSTIIGTCSSGGSIKGIILLGNHLILALYRVRLLLFGNYRSIELKDWRKRSWLAFRGDLGLWEQRL